MLGRIRVTEISDGKVTDAVYEISKTPTTFGSDRSSDIVIPSAELHQCDIVVKDINDSSGVIINYGRKEDVTVNGNAGVGIGDYYIINFEPNSILIIKSCTFCLSYGHMQMETQEFIEKSIRFMNLRNSLSRIQEDTKPTFDIPTSTSLLKRTSEATDILNDYIPQMTVKRRLSHSEEISVSSIIPRQSIPTYANENKRSVITITDDSSDEKEEIIPKITEDSKLPKTKPKEKKKDSTEKILKGKTFYFGFNYDLLNKYGSLIKKNGGKCYCCYPSYPKRILPQFESGKFSPELVDGSLTGAYLVIEKGNEGSVVPYLLSILAQIPVIYSSILKQIGKGKFKFESCLAHAFHPSLHMQINVTQPYCFTPLIEPIPHNQVKFQRTKSMPDWEYIEMFIKTIGCRVVDRDISSKYSSNESDNNYILVPYTLEMTREIFSSNSKVGSSLLRIIKGNNENCILYLDWVIEMLKVGHFIHPHDYLQIEGGN